MQIVKARFRSRDEFEEHYQPELPHGGLFVPTTSALEAGSGVIIEITCEGLPNKVLVRGVVRSWRPALPRLRVRACAVIAFDEEERTKRDFIFATLGGTLARKRKHTRIPVAVPVEYRMSGTARAIAADLTEISIGGALLRTPRKEETPPIGSELVLSLTPPGGAAPIEISGKVGYHAPLGGGAGLKFSFRDGGGARRLRELIRRLRVA